MLPLGETERGSLGRGVEVTGAGDISCRGPPLAIDGLSLNMLPWSLAGDAGEGKDIRSLVNRVRRENTPRLASHWKYLMPATDPSFFPIMFHDFFSVIENTACNFLFGCKKLTDRFVEYDSSPFSRSKLCVSYICDLTRFASSDVHSIADDKTISIFGQHNAVVWIPNTLQNYYLCKHYIKIQTNAWNYRLKL